MNDLNLNWPKKGDRVFKPSPVPSADLVRVEAFVMPSDDMYITGFQRAADMIVEAAKTDDDNPDELVFPVTYLYRHYLELMLKDMIRLGIRLGAIEVRAKSNSEPCPNCGHRKVKKDWQSEHNLYKLWYLVKRLLREVWPEGPTDDLNATEQMILEFHKLDPSGQAFRYAKDNKDNQHLQEAPDKVDLINLKVKMDAVSTFLNSASSWMYSCDPGCP